MTLGRPLTRHLSSAIVPSADCGGRFKSPASTTKAITIYCWLSSSSPTGRHNYGPSALGGKRGTFPNVAMQEVERAKVRHMAKKHNSKVERQKSSDKTLSKAPSIETKKQEK